MTGKFKPGHAPYNKGKQTEFLKMVRALSTMGGFATGLKELDIPAVIEGADDLKAWSKKAREISRTLAKCVAEKVIETYNKQRRQGTLAPLESVEEA